MAGKVFLLPVDFSLEGYKTVFKTNEVLIGYRNTIFYTVVGTFINVGMTMAAAYPLSRKDLPHRKLIMFLFTFTMIFSGGMIPTYIIVSELGLLNTPWAMLLPGALSVYNLIITRTFIENSIPYEVFEAAVIDGAGETRTLISIAVPLAIPSVMTNVMFYAVMHWNTFMSALLYVTRQDLQPLQVVLYNIISGAEQQIEAAEYDAPTETLKMAAVVLTALPIIIVYPFIQKYFTSGMLVGAIKG